MNDEMKNSTALTPVGDGFDNYSDRVEGDDGPEQQGLIRGTRLKFTNTAEWETPDDEVISPSTKMIVTDVARAVLKWGRVRRRSLQSKPLSFRPARRSLTWSD